MAISSFCDDLQPLLAVVRPLLLSFIVKPPINGVVDVP